MMSKEFWRAAGIRALHTFWQAAVGALIAAALAALGIIGDATFVTEVNWVAVVDGAAMAALCSILKSVAVGLPELEI